MLIPITIDGHQFWCSADSGGSRVLSLDLSKAMNAGLQPNASGSSAGVGPDVTRDQRVRGTTVEVGSIALRDVTLVLRPQPTVVPDIDCVLGLGLLSDVAVEFNYVTPAVRLIPSAQFRPSPTATAVPLSIDRTTTPSIQGRLRVSDTETVDLRLMVDTGASYYDAVLLKPFIDAHQITSRIGPVVPRFSDTAMTIAAARATALIVGPFGISGPITALISNASGGTFSVDGLLGAGFLRRFTVTFDYARQQLWLEPNGRTNGPQPFDASGIEVRRADTHDFVIVAVAPNSPGARAGLQAGDSLSAIDGRRARDMTLGDIQDSFNRSGLTCTVQIERDGHVQAVTLQLLRRL